MIFVVVPLGLASRRWPIGLPLYDDALGDALYAVMVYLALAILFPSRSPLLIAVASACVCLAIELFKLTGLPHAWRDSTLSRLVFGTVFGWHNVLRYAVGVACAATIDTLIVRPRSGHPLGDARGS